MAVFLYENCIFISWFNVFLSDKPTFRMADFGGERFDPTVSESKDSNEQEKVGCTS